MVKISGTPTYDVATIGMLNYQSGPVDPFLGTIDDVRIYDRALSTAEISVLAASPPVDCGGNSAPTAPTTPYSNDTTAQSGQTNPSGITDPTPAFSAIYNDPDSGDIANKYRVEVNTASDFGGTVMWDSGVFGGTSMADTTEGNRCPDIIYAGSALANRHPIFLAHHLLGR